MTNTIYAPGEHILVECVLKNGATVVFACLDFNLKNGNLTWTHADVEPNLITLDPGEIVGLTVLKTVTTRKGERLRKRAEKEASKVRV